MGTAFFPLDEQLELPPGQCTPRLQEGLVLLSAWMPFETAVTTMATLLGAVVSKSSAVRATEAAGAAYVELQAEELEMLEREAPPAPPADSERMVMSGDGAMVPLLHGKWEEVRTLAIGRVPSQVVETANRQTQEISYFSRLASAETFTQQALVETHRRGLENAQQVAAVMDGAEWLQGLADHHCPKATRILDFAHAAQRLAEVGQALWGEKSEQATTWTAHWAHCLKHEGPQSLLGTLRQLRTQYPQCEPLRINLAYLEKRQAQLCYPEFIRQGWPIGSGMIESANKSVVEARLKGAGMHWHRSHVNPMLALRNLVCNDRWNQEWRHIHKRLIAQKEAKRIQPCRQRLQAIRTQQHEATVAAHWAQYVALRPEPVADPQSTSPSSPSSSSPARRKPAPNHPWRRTPIGRARFVQNPKK